MFIDGGIRRGTDIFKALSLGAQAVLVSPLILYPDLIARKSSKSTLCDLIIIFSRSSRSGGPLYMG